jgi:DUF971 family protein
MSDPRETATDLEFMQTSRALRVTFADGARFDIPYELLRVETPSAEVRGHGGTSMLVLGKENVGVTAANPVGRYAVRIVFNDGHATGLYPWALLRRFGEEKDALLAAYRARVAANH